MKYLFSIGLLLGTIVGSMAQPSIQWQRTFGGSEADVAISMKETPDSCYIIAGRALSSNGHVVGNKGATDFWVLKVDRLGNLLWQKPLGGSSSDRCYSIDLTGDGGFILAGSTESNNGQVSGNHGDVDCWVVKLDQYGNIQWQKCLGGTSWEEAWCVRQTNDGGYIVTGRASSSNGDVTGHHGALDVWVIKLSATGNLEWQSTFGGSLFDIGYSIQQTSEGGYIVLGESNSTDGDCVGLHGSTDFWVIKLDSQGQMEWQKMLGSSSLDRPNAIIETNDGGYAVFGQISWNDGNVSTYYGGYDFWIAKLDVLGNLQWEATYGGTGEEFGTTITQTPDRGYLLAGASDSVDGDVLGNNGGEDLWIVKIDSLGNLVWQKTLGGTKPEWAHCVITTYDKGIALAGYAQSSNGDVSSNYGATDFWIVKLTPETSSTQTPAAIPLNLYPNPASHWITLNLPIIEQDMQVNITDEQGKLIQSRIIRTDEKLDIAALPPGIYWVSAVSKSGQVYAGKFVKG